MALEHKFGKLAIRGGHVYNDDEFEEIRAIVPVGRRSRGGRDTPGR